MDGGFGFNFAANEAAFQVDIGQAPQVICLGEGP
jgi:hypothetical protein